MADDLSRSGFGFPPLYLYGWAVQYGLNPLSQFRLSHISIILSLYHNVEIVAGISINE